ncbi:MAG TPA: tetratricopeptide repeat protein [Polyangia bacterium]|nr:tetratricopeptide repeat protein [Polyangia bacterium]
MLVALVLLAWWVSPAAADSADDAVAKITQMNRDAVNAYQAKKFDDARKILKQALDLADANGLDQHPITARTHIHMGIVIIGGFKQRDLGIKQFKKALEIEPTINLTKALVTPELTDAFSEAKSDGKADKAAAASPPPPPPPPPAAAEPAEAPSEAPAAPPPPAAAPEAPAPESNGAGLTHEQVTAAKQGSAISITVGVSPDLKFDKVVLAYRPEGASEFLGREMKAVAEGRYGAEIPTTATGGNYVAYYIEADDAEGTAIATKGSVEAPMTIALSGGGHATVKKKPEAGEEGEGEEEAPDYRYFAALMLGTGFGWATGVGDVNHDVSINPPGVSWARLGHIAPEFGYWMSSSLMLSVQLRYQFVTGTTDVHSGDKVFHAANYAFAAFAKATWRWDQEKFHPFFSLAAGGGQIRHVVTFGSKLIPPDCGPSRTQTCVDTIAAGPILVGPGGGVTYDLTDRFSLLAQANSVLGFPNFTFNVDIDLGVAMGF